MIQQTLYRAVVVVVAVSMVGKLEKTKLLDLIGLFKIEDQTVPIIRNI